MTDRSTRNVLADHLRPRRVGDLAADLERNYAPDIVLLCKYGTFRGCDEIQESAERLGMQRPNARFAFRSCRVHGDMAFLEWGADADGVRVMNGADSYPIRDGRIRVQTIHSTLIAG